MRSLCGPKLMGASVALAALLYSGAAQAQFTNHSIGFEAGYLIIDRSVGAGSGPDFGVNATLYIESGFDLYCRLIFGIHEDLGPGEKKAVGFFPALGVRYLFSEDMLRPYVGLNLAFMHFFGSDYLPGALFSANPNLGLEYYFDSNLSVGLQAEYHRILVLNSTASSQSGNAYAIVAKIAWGF